MAINKNYVPKLYKSTAQMTTRQWEDERRNSIGGSDMSVILGLGHYDRTKRELFYDKTGVASLKGSDSKQSIIFNSGHFLENMVADLFSYRTGFEAYEVKAMFEHPLHPHIRGNIDRFYRYRGSKEPIGFLECKTTTEFNSEWNNDKIPTQYIVQIATYMSILNMDSCKIACLFIPEQLRYVAGILYQLKNVFGKLPKNTLADIKDQLNSIADEETSLYVPMVVSALGGEFLIPKHLLDETSEAVGKKLTIRDVGRDEALEEEILEKADDFWFNYVEKGIEPPLDDEKGSAAIATLNKYIVPKEVKKPQPLSDKLISNIESINALKEKKSELNSLSKQYDSQIQKLSVPIIEALNGLNSGCVMGNNEEFQITYEGKVRKSVPAKNMAKLKNAYPDAYNECAVEKQSDPTLTIKAVVKK